MIALRNQEGAVVCGSGFQDRRFDATDKNFRPGGEAGDDGTSRAVGVQGAGRLVRGWASRRSQVVKIRVGPDRFSLT